MSFRKVGEYFARMQGTPVFLFSMAGLKLTDLHVSTAVDFYKASNIKHLHCPVCGNMTKENEDGSQFHAYDGTPRCRQPITLKDVVRDYGNGDTWQKIPYDHIGPAFNSYFLFYVGTVPYLYCTVRDSNTDFEFEFLAVFDRPVNSIGSALREMMPMEARKALSEGYEVQRQGDMYFIETHLETSDLKGKIKKGIHIHGTNHLATEAKVIDGVVYVRRMIKHKHDLRPNRSLSLGTHRWWKAVRSSVRSWRT